MSDPNNLTKLCEVCGIQASVPLTLLTCTHTNKFCESCLKQSLANRYHCPLCRTVPNHHPLFRTVPNYSDIIDVPTTDSLPSTMFRCFSIGLIIGLIIYPAVKQS
jgi:hypothetical protein